MARLVFPDEGSRLVYNVSGGQFRPAPNSTVTVYSDATAQTLADISLTSGGPSIAGSTLTTDAFSRLPVFYGPDGTDTLWVVVNGGPVSPVYARTDERIDAVNTALATKAATSYVDSQDTAALAAAHTYTDAETSRAQVAENANATAISSEITNRTNADTANLATATGRAAAFALVFGG